MADVIVLNGGSSSGKSSLARSLQEVLDEPWVTLGVDDLISALAPSLVGESPHGPDMRLSWLTELMVPCASMLDGDR